MLKGIQLILVLCSMAIIASCQSPKEKAIKQIKQVEALVLNPQHRDIDPELGKRVIAAYENYSNQFPEDPYSAECLFKAGEVSKGMGEYHSAVVLFERCEKEYSSNSKAPYALFFKGFILENFLNDTIHARVAYEQFLKRYPNHELKKDVNGSLLYLGKNTDELIQLFEQKQEKQGKK